MVGSYREELITFYINMIEHFFECPYCWERISMLLDASVRRQEYIEDCEVCCNPIKIEAVFENMEVKKEVFTKLIVMIRCKVFMNY